MIGISVVIDEDPPTVTDIAPPTSAIPTSTTSQPTTTTTTAPPTSDLLPPLETMVPVVVDLSAAVSVVDVGVDVARQQPVVVDDKLWTIVGAEPHLGRPEETVLVRIDPVTAAIDARVPLPGTVFPTAEPVDVFAGGGVVWGVTADGRLHKIDHTTAGVTESISVHGGGQFWYAAGGADAGSVWIAPIGGRYSNNIHQPIAVRRVDIASSSTEQVWITDPNRGPSVSVTDDAVWIGHLHRLDRVDPSTREIIQTVRIGEGATEADPDEDFGTGAHVLASDAAVWAVLPDRVMRLDAAAEVIVNLEVRADSPPVLVGDYLIVGAGDQTLHVVNTVTNTFELAFDLGPGGPPPRHLVVVGDELWFTGSPVADNGMWFIGDPDNDPRDSRFGRIPVDVLVGRR